MITKADIGRRIIITGCGITNVCKGCIYSCSKHVKDDHIDGIITGVTASQVEELSKINFRVEGSNDENFTRSKWVTFYKEPEQIVGVFF